MKNAYEVRGDVTAILFQHTDGRTSETLITTDDLPLADALPGSWCVTGAHVGRPYVHGRISRKEHLRLHRHLVPVPDGWHVDHINHNGLDNRRSNLRAASPRTNCLNKNNDTASRAYGLQWNRSHRIWDVVIQVNGQQVYVGSYASLEHAEALARAAREMAIALSVAADVTLL